MNRRDYCPIAAGVEVLGDRWTPLVIRELMVGADGFNEIHRGIPRASRTLLAQRLRDLERRGLIRHEAGRPGCPGTYALTAAGQALTPVVWALGAWAAEWTFGDPADADCDGLTLMWRLHQVAVPARLPETRTVVHLVLTGAGGAQGWLDIQRPAITVCKDDQGLAVDLALEADTAQMHRWLVGLVPLRDLLAAGQAASSDRAGWPRHPPVGSTPRCSATACGRRSGAGTTAPSSVRAPCRRCRRVTGRRALDAVRAGRALSGRRAAGPRTGRRR